MLKTKTLSLLTLIPTAFFSFILFILMGVLTFGSLVAGFFIAAFRLLTKPTAAQDQTIIDVQPDSVWFESQAPCQTPEK